ncbi:MAG: FecR domain-containing protein [Proteobacteria bacterium]|nr:FecR domain-containing protein [Pseudomonadota bacterium]
MKIGWASAIYLYRKRPSALMLTVFTVICWIAPITETYAASTCKTEVARVVSMQGIIEIRRAQENAWQVAGMDIVLCAGDMIRTRAQSRAALRLSNDSMLRLNQKTSITFPGAQEERDISLLNLFEGAIHIITRTPRPFKIRTPFVNASVEGTEFFVGLKEDNTEVVVYEGRVSVSNELGSLLLHDHEAAVTYKGQVPRKEIIIHPADAVQWALYYPAILNYWQSGKDGTSALIRQASQLLTVGQAEEAKEIIRQALQHEPDNSNAHALLAIIAVVQNDKDQALGLANKAITLDQESAAGHLALSYTQQAHFEIEAALENVQKALASDAQNALIWARLAELQMSVGYLERALDAAKLAVSLNPDLAKTQTVLGFAHLLQIDTQTAKEVFHRAIALDQSDPMPRLGLGIALIREGNLEAGRIELEIAASLDPANSLIRSYLGKAYFEEKRYSLAGTQFDLAKERDPKDPTPWFYDAIQKQTQNRPVEALQDIQKSIELNNNRAVYRSQFLLDRDEAARGSSLARIFENLGFERRAVMETAKSLSFDPANHSAHRFLSDTYANTPRHEAARVSELLQAQLLQPVNVNPVQPHMAVADLNIITNTGPSTSGFNEFAPLMERNKPQLVASGIVGSNSTLGNELVFSNFNERTSISLGQFHYETNGFRPNYDQRHNIYSAFLQHAFTEKFNMQAEVRTRQTQIGDLFLDGSIDFFSENKKQAIKQDFARIGAKYSLSPQQDIIASIIYTDRDTKDSDIILGFSAQDKPIHIPYTRKLNQTGYIAEIQHLFTGSYFNTVSGFSTYQVNVDSRTSVGPFPGNENTIKETQPSTTEERDKGYIYAYFNQLKNINLTTGISHDTLNEVIFGTNQSIKINKFNPKLGLQLDITDKLRIRLAWFETVKSALIANQTIEPTQIAGFNQLFDDQNGTRAERKGIGFDAAFSQNFYAGLEASLRNLNVPVFNASADAFEKQKEQLYRAYLYWLPHKNWSIRGEPQYEKYTRSDFFLSDPNQPTVIENVLIPLSINFFNTNGWMSSLIGTYVSQNLDRPNGHTLKTGTHDFFMLDSLIGYRLPKRTGLLSFEVKNILDQDLIYRNFNFNILNYEYRVSQFIPIRTFFVRFVFNY